MDRIDGPHGVQRHFDPREPGKILPQSDDARKRQIQYQAKRQMDIDKSARNLARERDQNNRLMHPFHYSLYADEDNPNVKDNQIRLYKAMMVSDKKEAQRQLGHQKIQLLAQEQMRIYWMMLTLQAFFNIQPLLPSQSYMNRTGAVGVDIDPPDSRSYPVY